MEEGTGEDKQMVLVGRRPQPETTSSAMEQLVGPGGAISFPRSPLNTTEAGASEGKRCQWLERRQALVHGAKPWFPVPSPGLRCPRLPCSHPLELRALLSVRMDGAYQRAFTLPSHYRVGEDPAAAGTSWRQASHRGVGSPALRPGRQSLGSLGGGQRGRLATLAEPCGG